jgi:hypothetical protein
VVVVQSEDLKGEANATQSCKQQRRVCAYARHVLGDTRRSSRGRVLQITSKQVLDPGTSQGIFVCSAEAKQCSILQAEDRDQ